MTHPNRSTLTILAALVSLSLASSIAFADEQKPEIRSEASRDIDAVVERWMESTGIPGSSVAVVRGGETIHLAGYGRAGSDGRQVTPDTPFLIGSVSKPFTAAAVYQLVQEGRLGWDEPVRPYLDAAVDAAAIAFEAITVEHLVMHTSGLSTNLALPGTVPVRAGDDALERRVADIMDQHKPTRSPGEDYEYSNANYILLAWIVERVAKVPFAEYIEHNVFGPLGMNSSFATQAHPRASDLASGHESWFGQWVASSQPYDPAGVAMGYMGSTARDLAAFLHAQLGPESHQGLPVRAPHVVDRPAIPTGWEIPLETAIADGWFLDVVGGHKTVSHAGSLGDYTAHVIMVPGADGLGIAVSQNASAFVAAGHEGQYGLSLELLELLLGLNREERRISPLMTVLVPATVWGLVVLILASAVRFFVRRSRSQARPTPLGSLTRRLLPAAVLVLMGLTVLLALPPLTGGTWRSVQLFYPDVAWGLLVAGWLTLGWGLAGVGIALAEARRA